MCKNCVMDCRKLKQAVSGHGVRAGVEIKAKPGKPRQNSWGTHHAPMLTSWHRWGRAFSPNPPSALLRRMFHVSDPGSSSRGVEQSLDLERHAWSC